MNQSTLSRLAFFCLAMSACGHALAASHTLGPAGDACPCATANAGQPPTAAEHAINTKGTGGNNGIPARGKQAQQTAPPAPALLPTPLPNAR